MDAITQTPDLDDADETPLEPLDGSSKTWPVDTTTAEPAKRTKTAHVPVLAYLMQQIKGLPKQKYSPSDRKVLRAAARQLLNLDSIGE